MGPENLPRAFDNSPSPEQPSGRRLGESHVGNSVLNLVGFVLNAGFNLLALMVMARRLGKDYLGSYYTIYAVMLLVQLVTEAGIPTVLTCRIVKSPTDWRDRVAEAGGLLALTILTSALAFFGMAFLWSAWSGDSDSMRAFVLAAIACASIHVQRFCAGVFQAFERFGYENFAKTMQGGIFAGLVAGFLGPGSSGYQAALGMFAVSHATAALYMVVGLQARFRCLAGRWAIQLNAHMMKGWLSEAGPLGVADVFRRLTWQLDTLLLGVLQPPAVVGMYNVACRPLATLNWLPQIILSATLPAFARMAGQDRPALSRAFITSIRLLWIFSLPIAVSICVCAEPVVLVIGGPEYLEAVIPMRILIWITCLLFLSVPLRFFFAALGESLGYARLVILIFVIEAVSEAALIPVWGYLGACAGSVLGECLFAVLGLILCRRLGLGTMEWRALWRAALAAVGMGAGLWFFRDGPFATLIAAGIVAWCLYFVACLLLGALRWQEVRQVFRRPGATASVV